MTVYVVMNGVNYEGENFVGVYSTIEKARDRIKEEFTENPRAEQLFENWLQLKENAFSFGGEYYYILTEKVDKD